MIMLDVQGVPLALPSRAEWDMLCNGAMTRIGHYPVLDARNLRTRMHYALQQGAYQTDSVQSFLQLPHWHGVKEWWPVMFHWPSGRPSLEELALGDAAVPFYLKVYFHRFHCFDCGLDLDGYAVEQDAYPSSAMPWEDMKKHGVNTLRCPACGGGMRHPLLVHIHRVHPRT